jgi:hypothetical protein
MARADGVASRPGGFPPALSAGAKFAAPSRKVGAHRPRRYEAISWLKVEIAAEKTYWGCGDVLEFSEVPRGERCDACHCHGKRLDRRLVIDDEGIAEDEPVDDCFHEE